MRPSVFLFVLLAAVLLVCVFAQDPHTLYKQCWCEGGCNAVQDSGMSFFYQCTFSADTAGCTASSCADTCYKACALCYGGTANAVCESQNSCQCLGTDSCVTWTPGPITTHNYQCLIPT